MAVLTGKNASINRASHELDHSEQTDESRTPLLSPQSSSFGKSAKSTVSTWSSSIAKHAQSFTGDADEDDDDEDVCDNLIRNIRQRTQEVTVRLPSSTKIDVDYHRKAKRQVRSIWRPLMTLLDRPFVFCFVLSVFSPVHR